MTTLLRIELERFRCRGVLWLVAGLLLLTGSGYVLMTWGHTAPASAAEVAAATEAFRVDAEGAKQFVERCLELQATDEGNDLDCRPPDLPTLSQYIPEPPELSWELGDAVGGMKVPVLIAALAMGVSFVTAEFGARTMGTWLTFAPRRSRVLASKTGAAVIGVLPAALAALAVTIGGVVLVYLVRGLDLGEASVWTDLLRFVTHLLPAAAVAAVLGAGLAFAVRNAAAVAGIVVWWALAVEVALPQIIPALAPATLGLNLRAWLEGGAEYTVQECRPDPDVLGAQVCEDVARTVGSAQGGLVLLLTAAVVLAIGALVFRRRAVT
ncbi:ABC transporter permease subunit [Cellulomonas rhizosphaerae]|uniref:Uncharacterized protein n=1 Tax=Cellulomonas rhizosphaerae TaxID=2293719 RepID=A0A413RIS0_9CELL|nr:ABC transporter permease subunit [Cellulomonas rhizosphaerae]RHA38316.1 hypothetical protein D1825_14565 [Cellulomonas rhizosphaerae]